MIKYFKFLSCFIYICINNFIVFYDVDLFCIVINKLDIYIEVKS